MSKISGKCFPSWMSLAELWMAKNFAGTTCVVFFSPSFPLRGKDELAERMKFYEKFFPKDDLDSVIFSDFAVFPTDTLDAANLICIDTPDNNPFTMVWDGERFSRENT